MIAPVLLLKAVIAPSPLAPPFFKYSVVATLPSAEAVHPYVLLIVLPVFNLNSFGNLSIIFAAYPSISPSLYTLIT